MKFKVTFEVNVQHVVPNNSTKFGEDFSYYDQEWFFDCEDEAENFGKEVIARTIFYIKSNLEKEFNHALKSLQIHEFEFEGSLCYGISFPIKIHSVYRNKKDLIKNFEYEYLKFLTNSAINEVICLLQNKDFYKIERVEN